MRFLFFILFSSAAYVSCLQQKPQTAVSKTHYYVDQGIDSLNRWISDDFSALAANSSDIVKIRESFFRGRKLYKRIEFAIEYFFPNTARNINGPPLPEIEPEEHIVLEPGGFQVVEEYLFPFNIDDKADLMREARKMKSMLVRASRLWAGHQFRDDQAFDALRMQYFRIITLGITGFDTPLSLTALDELPVSLQTINDVLNYYTCKEAGEMKEMIQRAKQKLGSVEFEAFDRLSFIVQDITPLT